MQQVQSPKTLPLLSLLPSPPPTTTTLDWTRHHWTAGVKYQASDILSTQWHVEEFYIPSDPTWSDRSLRPSGYSRIHSGHIPTLSMSPVHPMLLYTPCYCALPVVTRTTSVFAYSWPKGSLMAFSNLIRLSAHCFHVDWLLAILPVDWLSSSVSYLCQIKGLSAKERISLSQGLLKNICLSYRSHCLCCPCFWCCSSSVLVLSSSLQITKIYPARVSNWPISRGTVISLKY